jgi:hypothetical protein
VDIIGAEFPIFSILMLLYAEGYLLHSNFILNSLQSMSQFHEKLLLTGFDSVISVSASVYMRLERVQERRGCYRRLGRFMITAEYREDGMKWVRPGGHLSDNEYEEVLPSGDFRITIV